MAGRKEDNGVILLVDDQPESIFVVKSALDQKFIIKIATRGSLALKIAAAGGVDLILLDIVMPEMDGYEVCRRLKNNPETENIPVVFLTSKENQEDEVIGLELGAVDFIRKPSNPTVVLMRCINIVAYQKAKRALDQQNEKLQQALTVRENIERLTQHDLKGPLTGILGIPQIFLEADNLTEGQKTILRMMEKSGYVMLEMINRSLDLIKMENGSYQLCPEKFDLIEVLERVVGDLRRVAVAKGVTVEMTSLDHLDEQGSFSVVGEKMLCYPLFFNLILNAIEASDRDCVVILHLSCGNEGRIIRITNTGEVPEAIREQFFDKYVTFGKKNGTGLGTYSAWLSVKTQNGKINLDTSQPGRTTVAVTLPFSDQRAVSCSALPLHPAL